MIASLILGSLTTVVGGYVAGRYGKDAPITNALLFGLLGVAVGWLFVDKEAPLWFNIPGFMSIIPAAIFGGYVADRRTRGEGINSFLFLTCVLILVVGPVLLLLLLSGRTSSA